MSDTPSAEPSSSTHVHAAILRLPPFAPNEAITWFRRAETQFRLRNITVDTTKSDYVIESLPVSVFHRLAPWLEDQPDQIPYSSLKQKLLDEFSPTPSERARRVLSMYSEPMGDRTPTQIWNELNAMCRVPKVTDGTVSHTELDLKREIWLLCLPPHIRSLLHETDASVTIADLTKKADNLVIAHRTANRRSGAPAQSTVSCVADNSCDEENPEVTVDPVRPRRFMENKVRKPSFRRALNPDGICTYHQRFGNQARTCMDGCKFHSKN